MRRHKEAENEKKNFGEKCHHYKCNIIELNSNCKIHHPKPLTLNRRFMRYFVANYYCHCNEDVTRNSWKLQRNDMQTNFLPDATLELNGQLTMFELNILRFEEGYFYCLTNWRSKRGKFNWSQIMFASLSRPSIGANWQINKWKRLEKSNWQMCTKVWQIIRVAISPSAQFDYLDTLVCLQWTRRMLNTCNTCSM